MSDMESPLRTLRRGLGITQVELAAALGCSQSYISKLERGIEAMNGGVVKNLRSLFFDADRIAALQREFTESMRI